MGLRRRLETLIASAGFAFPGLVWASEHAKSAPSLFYPIINFTLYIAVLVYVYRKSISGALRVRKTSTEEHLQRAASELEEASAQFVDLARQLRDFEHEREKILQAFRTEGEEMARLLLEKGEQDARRIQEDVVKRREQDLRAAEAELRLELVQRSIGELRRKLESGLSHDEDRRLRREVLGALNS